MICEKPLGRNIAEARRLVELAEAAGLQTAYFENQIHMKPIQAQLAQLAPVQQKSMGPLSLARRPRSTAGRTKAGSGTPPRQGGGVLSDMGCHCIAVGWYVLTPPGKPVNFLEPLSVQADLALLKWGQPGWREKLLDGPRRGLRQDPGRGLRHGHGHLPQPRDRAEGRRRSSPSRGCTTSRDCACSWTAWARATPSSSTR